MKYKNLIPVLFVLLACCILPVTAADSSITVEGQLGVTNVVIDPGVFMYGDSGTVKVSVTNTGTTPVAIARAKLYSSELDVEGDENYGSVGSIGPGNSLDFTFTITADAPDGIYYPLFYLDLRDASSLRYRVPVKVENSGLSLSVTDQPDAFTSGKKEDVTIMVGNPRENTVNGVVITPETNGYETTETSHFIGILAPDQAAEATFSVTPYTEDAMEFTVHYRNGMNDHEITTSVPVVFGIDRKQAEAVLNNIQVKPEGDHYIITGDVTNAGLEDAKSVVVTTASPATPVDPYRSYVIGALEPDDFASFEATFSVESGTKEITLVTSYKDKDGNRYSDEIGVPLSSAAIPDNSRPVANDDLPLVWIVIVIICAAVVAGVIYYSWKKK
ncbi:COG1361 S-layer family protein [Methanogenium cariaci]